MVFFVIILFKVVLMQIGSFAATYPVLFEIIKMLTVSIGWIGGLAAFVWVRDKTRQSAPAVLRIVRS